MPKARLAARGIRSFDRGHVSQWWSPGSVGKGERRPKKSTYTYMPADDCYGRVFRVEMERTTSESTWC